MKIYKMVMTTVLLLGIVNIVGMVGIGNAEIIVKTNRFVVLDDPNDGTAQAGYFNPSQLLGRSWGSNYWSGESTKISSVAIVIDRNGSVVKGAIVNFILKNPGGIVKNTGTGITDNQGMTYYSFDLNEQRYWGNWKIEASANIDGMEKTNSTYFIMNFWGCAQCHGIEDPGKWGSRYIPKSYYTMGYDFHRSQQKDKHTEAMSKGNCIICHQSYNGTSINWKFTDNTPTLYNDNEYSNDWHKGKAKCQDCHAGSNRSVTPQGVNPGISECYDCHPKKNVNVTRVNLTNNGKINNEKINYSNIPSNYSKAHSQTGITCIACHSAGHNISKPFNDLISSNSYTEDKQCWQCHTTRPNHPGQQCTGCHSQNAHNVTNPHKNIKTEQECRSCHGNNTSDRHHNLVANGLYQCEYCHPVIYNNATGSYGVQLERNCLVCHKF